ncbi:Ribonuclease HII [termite gut metagenome]|uniref:Ribonuclease HII n=1 Tax=termite gut metagenome TaxID=433724 RepID=A0A5J4QWL5_9ZZZZ
MYAAAVIFPNDFQNEYLNNSKQLSEQQRYALRDVIQQNALAWTIGIALPEEIDKINILNASFLAMQRAIDALRIRPKHLLIDGNHFKQYTNISHTNIIKGYGKYLSIAAASILAKTHRDDYMNQLHAEFPVYEWNRNKGYPTHKHRRAIIEHNMVFRPITGSVTICMAIIDNSHWIFGMSPNDRKKSNFILSLRKKNIHL